MTIPSKELLIELLGDDYNSRIVDWFQVEQDNFLRSYYDCGKFDEQGRPTGLGLEINIYELAYKCKEYIIRNNYSLYIMHDTCGLDCRVMLYKKSVKKYFYENTEPEALFLACEWILKETK